MSMFGNFFASKSKRTRILKEAREYYLSDLSRILTALDGDEEKIVIARGVLGLFQQTFTQKFGSIENYLLYPADVRREYLETISSLIKNFNQQGKETEELGLLIFTILLSAAELQDETLQDLLDARLVSFFNGLS